MTDTVHEMMNKLDAAGLCAPRPQVLPAVADAIDHFRDMDLAIAKGMRETADAIRALDHMRAETNKHPTGVGPTRGELGLVMAELGAAAARATAAHIAIMTWCLEHGIKVTEGGGK